MSEETRTRPAAPPGPEAPRPDGAAADAEEFSAAAPPPPGAAGTGETSFGDAEAPPAGQHVANEVIVDELDAVANERDGYLALAQRTQADFENYRKRMARENAAASADGAGSANGASAASDEEVVDAEVVDEQK